MELEEVKVVVFLPKELKEIFKEVLKEEKKDKNLKENDEEFVFEDFPRKYASWWGKINPKRIFLKFYSLESSEKFKRNEGLTFILQPGVIKGWFEYPKGEGSDIVIKFNPFFREKRYLARQVLNSIIGVVRWKEIREKFFMLPWGPRPGQRMEMIKEFSELSFLSPLDRRDIEEIVKRKKEGFSKIVTGICLHADEKRERIVERLNEEKVSKIKKILESLPHFVKEIDVFTFHPEDIQFLKENEMESVILPDILKASDSKDQLKRHWQLTQEVFSSVSQKVRFYSIKDLFSSLDSLEMKKIENEAKQRTEKMLEFILKNPPPVFRFLSPEEQKRRVQAEAKLLLAVTAKFAVRALFYLGLEVHSRYWEMGKLYEWKNCYLPTLWLSSELRQPWGF